MPLKRDKYNALAKTFKPNNCEMEPLLSLNALYNKDSESQIYSTSLKLYFANSCMHFFSSSIFTKIIFVPICSISACILLIFNKVSLQKVQPKWRKKISMTGC